MEKKMNLIAILKSLVLGSVTGVAFAVLMLVIVPIAYADIVQGDDVIVEGSLCSSDNSLCGDGENFTFPALSGGPIVELLLKDNHPNLLFMDTDTNESDWLLTVDFPVNEAFHIQNEESGNIPFVIENGAGTNLLYLDSNSRIGINTDAPAYTVDAIGDQIRLRNNTSGTARTIALRVDGSATDIEADNANLWIRTDSSLSGTDYNIFLLPGTANVGVGTTSPTQKLHVNGNILSNGQYLGQYAFPGFWLDETGAGNKGLYYVLDSKSLQIQRRAQNFGAFEATVMHVFIEAPANSFYLASNGYLGLGRAPLNPIHHSNGAYLSAGGAWVPASSRDSKENIESLTADAAIEALKGLNPVTFNYKVEKEEKYAGFVAEDVPEIVAMNDRKGVNPMDIVAVLAKVAQEQQKTISELKEQNKTMSEEVKELKREMKLRNSLAMTETD